MLGACDSSCRRRRHDRCDSLRYPEHPSRSTGNTLSAAAAKDAVVGRVEAGSAVLVTADVACDAAHNHSLVLVGAAFRAAGAAAAAAGAGAGAEGAASSTPVAVGESIVAEAGGLLPGGAAVLHPGDVQSVSFRVAPPAAAALTAAASANPNAAAAAAAAAPVLSLGSLDCYWRRAGPADDDNTGYVTISGEQEDGEGEAGAAPPPVRAGLDDTDALALRPGKCAFLAPQAMPQVQVVSPPVAVRLALPPFAVIGEPFDLVLLLSNHSATLRPVGVTLSVSFPEDAPVAADSKGATVHSPFLCAGPTSTSASLPPRHSGRVGFRLVPNECGRHFLPFLSVVDNGPGGGSQPVLVGTGGLSAITVLPQRPADW